MSAISYRSYAAADVERLNRVVERLGQGSFPLLGGDWSYQLSVMPEGGGVPSRNDKALFIEWGGAHFELRLPSDFAARLYRHGLGEDPPLTVPEPIAVALMDRALEQPIQSLETVSGRKIRLVPGRPEVDMRFAFSFVLTSQKSNELVAATLIADSGGLILLAMIARRAPEPPLPPMPDDFPLVLRFEVGFTDVALGVLRTVGKHDLILLDQAVAKPDAPLVWVRTGLTARFRARLNGTQLVVIAPLEQAMPDQIDPVNDNGAPLNSLDDLAVRLTFDVGERAITLGELKALKAGHVFELGREVQRLVTIRANGRPIGHGELVAIDDRVGVAVHELTLSGVRVPMPSSLAAASDPVAETPARPV